MPIKKTSKRKIEPITKRWVTVGEVGAAIFAEQRPSHWRLGQFVFNRASMLYGDDLVRSVKYDPFYNDENIVPFIEALTEALNKLN
jgi:hypothetical protein